MMPTSLWSVVVNQGLRKPQNFSMVKVSGERR